MPLPPCAGSVLYVVDIHTSAIMQEKLKLQKASKILHRPINHKRFVNLPSNRVEQALKNPDWNNVDKLRRIPGVDPKGAKDGDFLFYPSQKGSDRIVACIRLFKRDNTVPVFQHIDFMETKSQKGAGNNLALGTPLKLQHFPFLNDDETQFEDLDDLGVNFVKKYVVMCAYAQMYGLTDAGQSSTAFLPVCNTHRNAVKRNDSME